MSWKKDIGKKLLLLTFSVAIALGIAEFSLRIMINSGEGKFTALKDPDLFADILWEPHQPIHQDDYFKMLFDFGLNEPPKHTHPQLGWLKPSINDMSFRHKDEDGLENKRPVLLYGDSFSMCVDGVECFEDILNEDTTFNQENWLLNYGVGGYGLGQISLMYDASVDRFLHDDPFVTFGFLLTDLDRTVLSIRDGQKPWYSMDKEELLLSGYPVEANADSFFQANKGIDGSLLLRRIRNLQSLREWRYPSNAWQQKVAEIKTVNEALMLKASKDLSTRGYEHVFLVFIPIANTTGDWRMEFIRSTLEANNIPYIWTLDLIEQDTSFSTFDGNHYAIPGDGHPTTHYNQLISQTLKDYILNDSLRQDIDRRTHARYELQAGTYTAEAGTEAWYRGQILGDMNWLFELREKARAEGKSFDEVVRANADYMVGE